MVFPSSAGSASRRRLRPILGRIHERGAVRRDRPVARRSPIRVAIVFWSVMAMGWLAAVPVDAAAPEAAQAEALVPLLVRIQSAARRENYVGTFVHQQGSQIQSSRITHAADRKGEHEKLELLDGPEREFVRHNDDVRCYMADRKIILVERRAKTDSFPALLTSDPVDLDRYYAMEPLASDRIAGRIASGIHLKARDGSRYGYRLWYDRETSLLLKAQTLGEKDAVVEQVAFSDVTIGRSIDPSRVRPTIEKTDGWRTEVGSAVPVDLARAGWSVDDATPGFRKVMEVRRAFEGRDNVAQMVFSDGLAAISVFIESGSSKDASDLDAARGPMHVVTRRIGGHRLTVVGDVPSSTAKQIAQAMRFSDPDK